MLSSLRRWLAGPRSEGRSASWAYYDARFADANLIEDDYRRLSRPRNQPGALPPSRRER
jgi:hypothetical protein